MSKEEKNEKSVSVEEYVVKEVYEGKQSLKEILTELLYSAYKAADKATKAGNPKS